MFSQSAIAMFSATRLLFKSRRVLALMLAAYAGLLTAVYLFVITREATISQLVLTLVLAIVAPALFFILQAVSISYTCDSPSWSWIKKLSIDCLKLIVVSVPAFVLTVLALYGLHKLDTHPTVVTTLRYLLIGLVAPLIAIQLWVATSVGGFRSLLRSMRKLLVRTFAPQSVLVYACGFLIFAVAPYFLVVKSVQIERAWLELSILVLRLSLSALLILLGWIATVGAISTLSRSSYSTAHKE